MKKILFTLCLFVTANAFSQNIFFDDFSTFNNLKLDGQGGYTSATPSLGNGTGSCFGVNCAVPITNFVSSYPSFAACTKALSPVDGILATGDGPGKSLGAPIISGSVYVALLVNFKAQNASATTAKQVIRLMDNSFGTATRIYIKFASAGAYVVGCDKNGGAAQYTSSSFSYNQDHLIILKYKFNTTSTNDDEASLFVDPDLTQPEPLPAVSVGGTDATTINRIAFPWNTSNLPNGFIGAVSVAKSWASIVPSSSPTYSISGRVATAKKIPVPNVKIIATSASSKDSAITNSNGEYTISNLQAGDYVLKAKKLNETTKANGVGSSDVIFIQRNVVGLKLNNAYKLIAADVTGDGQINSQDVIRTKRLITAADTTFNSTTKGSRTWEFVDSTFTFVDTTNPFPFKDSIKITGLNANKINQTFIGCKLGDVDWSWNPAVAKGIKNKTSISYSSTKNKDGNYLVSFTTNKINDLASMQFTLNFDFKNFEVVNVKNNAIQIESNTLKAKSNGQMPCLWINETLSNKSINSNEVLFTMELKPKNNALNSSPVISLSNDIVEMEVLDSKLDKQQLELLKK